MSAQVFGTAIIYVNGAALRSEPGAKISVGGYTRKVVTGDQPANVGFAQQVKESEVSCTLMMDAGTSLTTMATWDDVTIQFACDTGQNYVINHGWLADPPEATSGDGGKVALKFNGPPAVEA